MRTVLLALGIVTSVAVADRSTVLFASSETLLQCLAVRRTPGAQQALLALVDCPTARGSSGHSGAYAVEWDRGGFEGAQELAALRVHAPRNRGLGVCLAPDKGDSVVASETACTGGHLWRWERDSQRLWVTEVGAPSNASGLCLRRSAGGDLALAECESHASQRWLPLGRGAADPNARLEDIRFPLRAHGRRIVDAEGRIVRLRGVNWYGAHMEQTVNNGLDKQPIAHIARLIRHLGFNHVRLNYAVAMWVDRHTHRPVKSSLLSANPQLIGKSDIEVFDAVVQGLTAEGLLVVVNAHTSDHRWCCSFRDENGLWYNDRYTEADWLESLQGLADRYAHNPRVIGFDVRNEPRPTMPQGSSALTAIWWDTQLWGNCTEVSVQSSGEPLVTVGSFSSKGICLPQFFADWRAAATQATYAVLRGDQNSLVFIEGVGAAELVSSKLRPMALSQSGLMNRIVWSIHDYTWAWRWFRLGDFMTNGVGSLEEVLKALSGMYNSGDTDLKSQDYASFREERVKAWAFMLTEDRAPVWVGEFGEMRRSEWWTSFLRWAGEVDLDWCYWAIDGYKYPPGVVVDTSILLPDQAWGIPNGKPTTKHLDEPFGLFDMNYAGAKQTWKLADLLSIQAPVLAPDNESIKLPEDVVFKVESQLVKGTGPHPVGISGFFNFETPTGCGEGLARQLASSAAPATSKVAGNDSAVQYLVQLAHTHMEGSCSRGDLKGMSESQRERAREILRRSEPEGPNPVEEALRSPTKKEAQAAFKLMLAEQMDNARSFFTGFFVVLALTIVLIVVLHCVGRQRGCCRRCRCRPWRPPVGLTAMMSKTRAFRPFLAACYIGLSLGIIGAAIWGFLAILRSKHGVSTTECAAMRGMDSALSGDVHDPRTSRSFVGLLPALAHIENLTVAIARDSPEWLSTGILLSDLNAIPVAMADLRSTLIALGNFSDPGACASINTTAVTGAYVKVEWSIARAFEFLVPSVKAFEPRGARLVHDLQTHLATARARVQEIRDFAVQELLWFYENNPLALASEAAQIALLVLMAVFFVLVLPMLAFSTAAAVLFIFHDSLPEGPRCHCCRFCGRGRLRFHGDAARQLFTKTRIMRPRAAWIVWTCGLWFGVIALGLSLWLRSSTQVGASVCGVLDTLDGAALEEYAPALGIAFSDDTPVGRITKSLIFGCLGAGPDPFGGSLIEVQTCPADKLPSSFGGVFHDLDAEAKRYADKAAEIADTGKLLDDRRMQSLIQSLTELGSQVETGERAGECDSAPALWDQMVALRRSGRQICGDATTGRDCADFFEDDTGIDPRAETARAASVLASLLRQQAEVVDELVLNVTALASENLYRSIREDIAPHAIALADSLDCRFLGLAVQTAVDGICFEVLVGLMALRDALLLLGCLSIAMSVVMYNLWLRLKAFRAIAEAHYDASAKAASGGTPANLSSLSRRLARGDPGAASWDSDRFAFKSSSSCGSSSSRSESSSSASDLEHGAEKAQAGGGPAPIPPSGREKVDEVRN